MLILNSGFTGSKPPKFELLITSNSVSLKINKQKTSFCDLLIFITVDIRQSYSFDCLETVSGEYCGVEIRE